MSKRKNIIRVGDRIKILVPDVVVRVGYPLSKADMLEKQTPEQLKAIRDMFKAFGRHVYDEELPVISTHGLELYHPGDVDRLYEKIRYIMAGDMLAKARWGGRERTIHTYSLLPIKDKFAEVIGRRIVKTGTYFPASGGMDYWGECDYEPAGLANEKTHVLYTLNVYGYGYWWSKMRTDDAFLTTKPEDSKDIEIEGCNLIKIDPKNPPTDEDEHPSGLTGEHSVVLDAIHQECLRNR